MIAPEPEDAGVADLRLIDPQPRNGTVFAKSFRLSVLFREELNLFTCRVVDTANGASYVQQVLRLALPLNHDGE